MGLPPSELEGWPVDDIARLHRVDQAYGLHDRRLEGVLGALLAASGACKSAKDVERFLPMPPVPVAVQLRRIRELAKWRNQKPTVS
tara:strand:+ start:7681 stop:7938 length:258 start_codon:yes stop_codon:yes gene_type:complete